MSGWTEYKPEADKIRYAATEYSKDGNFTKIAQKLGMNASNLWKILTRRSGTIWTQEFTKPNGVVETVPTEVPALLTPETIEKIKSKSAINKKFYRGKIKNNYLLRRVVFCEQCGYSFFGQTNRTDRRYYRHVHTDRKKSCDPSMWIPAQELEDDVMAHLFGIFGEKAEIKQAVAAAFPTTEEVPKIEDELTKLQKDVVKIKKKMDNIVASIGDAVISKEQAAAKMRKYQDKLNMLQEEIILRQRKIEQIPSKQEISNRARQLRVAVAKARNAELTLLTAHDEEQYYVMSFKNKRALIESVFMGKGTDGRQLGVYVKRGSNKGEFTFSIRGILPEKYYGEIVDNLPMSATKIDRLVNSFDYQEAEKLDFSNNSHTNASSSPGPVPPERRSPAGSPRPGA